MTQNVRYCPGCGAARCGTCGRRPQSLKRDTQDLARSTGADAGALFWGGIAAISAIFWPSIFVHGPHRLPCEIGWYSFLGAVALLVLICASANLKPKTGVPLVPVAEPPSGQVPDLRQSDAFEGKW